MPKTYISKKDKNHIIERSGRCCEYCKCLQDYSSSSFACEHIILLALNGNNDLDNLANACGNCNGSKHAAISALDPITNQIVPLFHPRKDNWNDHFKWSHDLLKMEGLTPTGRATIIRLKTNRQENLNLRSVLIGKGHPPK